MTPEQTIRQAIIDYPGDENTLSSELAEVIVDRLEVEGFEIRPKLPELDPTIHVGTVIAPVAITASGGLAQTVKIVFTGHHFDAEPGQEVHVIAGRTTAEQANVDGKNWAVIGTDLCVHHTPKKVAPTPAELAAADDLTTAMVDEVIAEAERAKDDEQ